MKAYVKYIAYENYVRIPFKNLFLMKGKLLRIWANVTNILTIVENLIITLCIYTNIEYFYHNLSMLMSLLLN